MQSGSFTEKTIDFADAVIRYCLPAWVPSLSMMVGAATMGAALVYKLVRVTNAETL